MKKISAVLLMLIALPTLAKEPQIASNSSGVTDGGLINNIAASAIGMGTKEPLNISEIQANGKRVLVVSGSNGTSCKVPISDDNKMSGISCK